jgi:hypothetical protein
MIPRGSWRASSWQRRRAMNRKKVPFIGAFYAGIEFEPTLSVGTAKQLLRLLDRLTCRELVVISYLATPGWRDERADASSAAETRGVQVPAELIAEVLDLANQGLVGYEQESGEVVHTLATWGGLQIGSGDVSRLGLTELGHQLAGLADLSKIPSGDQAPIAAALRGGPL